MKLTEKQERFAQEWFRTGNKSEAYRRSYSWKNCTEATINRQAHELARNPKILARFEQFAAESQKRVEVDADTIAKMYKSAFVLAKKQNKPSAMVSAAAGLSKLYGVDAEVSQRLKSEGGNKDTADALRELANKLPN